MSDDKAGGKLKELYHTARTSDAALAAQDAYNKHAWDALEENGLTVRRANESEKAYAARLHRAGFLSGLQFGTPPVPEYPEPTKPLEARDTEAWKRIEIFAKELGHQGIGVGFPIDGLIDGIVMELDNLARSIAVPSPAYTEKMVERFRQHEQAQ